MLEKIVSLLQFLQGCGAFACRATTKPEDLRLEVTGVGAIRLPVSARLARKLCRVARPARFGLRDRTLLDKDVRDTWEIARSRVKIDQRRWKQTLEPQLEKIKMNLGLPKNSHLEARLDKLLVYEPGQFFVSHQDSEKADDMIGTLSVVLPSSFSGGAEVIEHRGEKVSYRRTSRSGEALTFIAFYADCRHEVKPVKAGFRVALVYNLLLHEAGDSPLHLEDVGAIDRLVANVATHFEDPVAEYSWRAPEPPEKLVYLLDHEYTQRSLAWHRLKNADALRAAALHAVAERLDCEIHLALADIHETWSCEDESDSWGYRGYGDFEIYDDDEDQEDFENDGSTRHEHLLLTELIDGVVELRYMIDTSGEALDLLPCHVASTELCCTKPNAEIAPFEAEYEGWMGNYGNTMDRWYHRAAVVLWPRSRSFSIRAQGDPSWAIAELATLLQKRRPQEARAQAQSLVSFWPYAVSPARSKRLLSKTMRVACALCDRALAASLLGPFTLDQLGPTAVPPLAGLLETYGLPWCRKLFLQWDDAERGFDWDSRRKWYEGLRGFCEALCATGTESAAQLAQGLVAHEWDHARAECTEVLDDPGRPEAFEELTSIASWLIHVLESSVEVDHHNVRDAVMRFLVADETGFPVEALSPALRGCRERHTPRALKRLALGGLLEHCASTLTKALAHPRRDADDWTIDPPMKCTCDLCRTLGRFLASEDRIRLEWPLAKEKRRHIHQQIDRYELTVSHVTKRKGRPFTLLLSKRKDLFTREAARRKRLGRELTWIKRQRHVFS